jgi:hypothetical protein
LGAGSVDESVWSHRLLKGKAASVASAGTAVSAFAICAAAECSTAKEAPLWCATVQAVSEASGFDSAGAAGSVTGAWHSVRNWGSSTHVPNPELAGSDESTPKPWIKP